MADDENVSELEKYFFLLAINKPGQLFGTGSIFMELLRVNLKWIGRRIRSHYPQRFREKIVGNTGNAYFSLYSEATRRIFYNPHV